MNIENKTLKEIEKVVIVKHLDKNEGHMTKTAKSLGITRATLYNKIKEYKIKRN